ncbi:MAG TPA: ABC transporter ATP-binding protein [Chloroflexota bacterium]|nr:ABC transporter ATP-binding protein [Chloroflexota bacterium]
MTSALEVAGLCSAYGQAPVLEGVSLVVPKQRVVAVLGRNGMGKTSLIRSIMALAPPTVGAGSVRYGETELLRLAAHQIARLGIGYVPQGRHIFRSLTVLEHLDIVQRPGRNGHTPWTVDRVFELFPRLAERAHHRGGQLSGGEQSMLAIGRALMTNPDLLIMDEPSEGLAPLLIRELGTRLLALKEEQLSILLVEQNLALAVRLADEIYLLDRGCIVHHGSPAELEASAELKQRYLGVG